MFCELIGKKVGMIHDCNELFLVGLLSVMDALLNVPMPGVLAQIPVDDDIKNALTGRDSRYRPIFEVVLDYESGTWEQLAHSARHIGLHENFLPDLYLRAVQWPTCSPTRPFSSSKLSVLFCKNFGGQVERSIGRGHSAIDRGLQ